MGIGEYLSWIGTAIFVVFFFGMCIFVHELGHFLAAKWRGLHIDAFSIGFRKIWAKKINGVEYRIGWLPFGGYVELPQVDGSDAEPKAADGTVLPQAKPWDRIITAVAGPIFNIVFGLLLGCVIWVFGVSMPWDSAKMREMEVIQVGENSPEYAAGLRTGDRIVKLNGQNFNATWLDFARNVMLTTGEVKLEVLRDGRTVEIAYVPAVNPNAPENMKFEGMPWPFFTVRIPVEIHPAPDSPLARAGVRSGDQVTAVDGHPINDTEGFIIYMNSNFSPVHTFTILRDGRTIEIEPVTFPVIDAVYRIGVSFSQENPLIIDLVGPDSPAQRAGIQVGDRVVSYNHQPVTTVAEMQQITQTRQQQLTPITVERDGQRRELEVAANKQDIIDLQLGLGNIDYPTPFEQLAFTVNMSYKSLTGMLTYLGNKMYLTETKSSIKPRNMSGPVGIITTLFVSATHSFTMGVFFVVVICFALAIFNLLPLPVLDGGHATMGLIEIVFRRPLPRCVVKVLTYIFISVLIFFMLYVTFYDFWRLYNIFAPEPEKTPEAIEVVVEPADVTPPPEAAK